MNTEYLNCTALARQLDTAILELNVEKDSTRVLRKQREELRKQRELLHEEIAALRQERTVHLSRIDELRNSNRALYIAFRDAQHTSPATMSVTEHERILKSMIAMRNALNEYLQCPNSSTDNSKSTDTEQAVNITAPETSGRTSSCDGKDRCYESGVGLRKAPVRCPRCGA